MEHLKSYNRTLQISIALTVCLCLAGTTIFLKNPLVLVAGGMVPILIICALRLPLPLALAFAIFSFFRIHEAFPILYPLHIPQLLALGALASLAWGVFTRSVTIYISREMLVLGMFFILVTISMIFATNRPEAWASWSGTYIKIIIMTFALAWLMTTTTAFRLASFSIIVSGIAVGTVALFNKINSIGLVEGTRVTIGRDIGSMLGDPNDLALVMLFPASFSLVAVFNKNEHILLRVLAAISFIVAFSAIIATQSRGGLLGIAMVMGVFAWRRIQNKGLIIAFVIITLIGLFALAGVDGRASGGAHEEGIDESAMGRIYAWGAAWQMALSHPFMGVGINNFISNYWSYSAHWDGNNHAVHSTWFGVLAETGFLGFFIFMSMVAVTVRSAVRSVGLLKNRNTTALAMAQAVEEGLFGFLVSGTFLTMGFTWPFYILLAMTTAVSRFVQVTSSSGSHSEKP